MQFDVGSSKVLTAHTLVCGY